MRAERREPAASDASAVTFGRRDFLKLMGVSAGAAALGCDQEWSVPDRLVELALRGPRIESQAQTICGSCESGCGLTVRLVDGLPVGLKGNRVHPLSRGGLCPVGLAGLEILYAPGRIRGPLMRTRGAEPNPTTWEEALGTIGNRLTELRAAGDGARVAIISDEPGQLFHEFVERFAGTIGSANVARSSVPRSLPFRLTQGLDAVPAFDLGRAGLVLSFGLDIYEDGPAPIHAVSAMVGARPTGERCRLIHVGTRLSPSATKAQEHLPVRPGTHGALALGIAHVLVREGKYDRDFVAKHTSGFDDWTDERGRRRMGFRRLLLERYYPDRVAQICGCDAARVLHLARRFAAADAPVAVCGGEATAGSNATWTAVAVHSLNALLGAFQRPGGVLLPPQIPFTPLDSPPAVNETVPPSIFAPSAESTTFGLDPIGALADGVLDGTHPLEVLFVVNSNPVHSSPAGDRLRQAMAKIPMVVVMAPFPDETAAHADLILPTHVFLESWQESTTPETVAMSTFGLGHPAVEPLFDTRHPGDMLLSLTDRIGGPVAGAFPWESYVDYLKHRLEGVVASGQGAIARGAFEETWVNFLEARGWRFLKHRDVDDFWRDLVRDAGWWTPVRTEADWSRVFTTPSGRFEFFSRTLEQHLAAHGVDEDGEACLPHYEPPADSGEGEVDLVCFRPITARGRLGVVSPMVLEMFGHTVLSGWTTWIEFAPTTAHELHIEHGDTIAVESERGSLEGLVRVQAGATPGVAHVPVGLGHSELNAQDGQVGFNPADVVALVPDTLDGALTLAPTRVRVRMVQRRRHGGPPPHGEGHS